MSPTKKASGPVLDVAVSLLPALLDFPAGTTIAGVEVEGDVLRLRLAGDDLPAAEQITADYSVDAAGRRTFNTFKLPDDQPEPPANTGTTEKE